MQEYRRHIADLEGKMVGARKRYLDDPSTFTNIFTSDTSNTYM